MDELKKAPATSALMIINILVFLLVDFTGGTDNSMHMVKCGAAFAPYIVYKHEYYRLFTSMFLHFGMAHLANNMLVLFVMGGRLEKTLGKIRFLLVYFLGGICGNLFSLWMAVRKENFAISAGASGGVFAIIGALAGLILLCRGQISDLSSRQILTMAFLSLYLGFVSSGVDNEAHFGGMIGGFLLGGVMGYFKKKENVVP